MQVVLTGGLVEGPSRATERGFPVGGLAPVYRVVPNVVVVIRIGLGAAGLLEPCVFIRGVVDHQVHHQANAALLHARQHGVKVGHAAKLLHDAAVVTNVVAVVVVGRVIHRRQPDNTNTQCV